MPVNISRIIEPKNKIYVRVLSKLPTSQIDSSAIGPITSTR